MSSQVPSQPASTSAGHPRHPRSAGYAGTADYIASPDLMQTVNVAVTALRAPC